MLEEEFEDEHEREQKMKNIQGTLAYKICAVEDKAMKSLNTVNSGDTGDSEMELWSVMGGEHRDDKFDISKNVNRVDLTATQIEQMMFNRAKGRRGFTLHGYVVKLGEEPFEHPQGQPRGIFELQRFALGCWHTQKWPSGETTRHIRIARFAMTSRRVATHCFFVANRAVIITFFS